ncbi:MAG: CopG family ribbon-helix-helix protein [Bacillota bacterium]
MDNVKRVMISLPHNLLEEIDGFIQKNGNGNRSEFIREAMKLYLQEKRRQEIREKLRHGYMEMSDLNLKLADEGIEYDARLMYYYEESLAECE